MANYLWQQQQQNVNYSNLSADGQKKIFTATSPYLSYHRNAHYVVFPSSS
jgi:hypothetical protein